MTDAYEQILDRIADGESLIEACKRPGMPDRRTVQRRCRTDAEFARAYQAAVEDRAEARAQHYADVLARLEAGDLDPSTARILLDGIKFQMANDDRRYAERTRIEATGKDGAPLISDQPKMSDFEAARYIAFLLSQADKKPPAIDMGELRPTP